MSALRDLRRHRRVEPPSPLRVRFELKSAIIPAVEIVSVGPGGFGAWVEDRYAALFEPGGLMKGLVFDDPALPEPPRVARVVFSTLKGQSARAGYIMIGAEFSDMPEPFYHYMQQLGLGEADED